MFGPLLGAPAAAGDALFFTSLDGAFDGAHGAIGFDYSLAAGKDRRGFVLRATAGQGRSRWRMAGTRIVEEGFSGRALLGWRETGAWGEATFFLGVGVEDRNLSPLPLAEISRIGTRIGPAAIIDAWLTPAPNVVMQAFVSYAAAHDALGLRLALGREVASGVHLGPEIGFSRHHQSSRWRFGGFVSGPLFHDIGLRLSLGYAQDPGGRGGLYGSAALWRRL